MVRKVTPHLKNKGDKTEYDVKLTGEQIMLIRSLHLRMEA